MSLFNFSWGHHLWERLSLIKKKLSWLFMFLQGLLSWKMHIWHIILPAAAAAKSLQSCPTLCDPIDGSPPGSPGPWDSPGKNTGLGCHFLLQCMKVKSESEVVQSCLTLSDPMDCSLPDFSIHGIFQSRVLEWGCHCLLWLYFLEFYNCMKIFSLYILIFCIRRLNSLARI